MAQRLAGALADRLARSHWATLIMTLSTRRPAAVPAINASTLFAAFEQNEIAANRQLKGQVIRVRGTVSKIGTDILGTPYVALQSDRIFSVQAMFSKAQEAELAVLRPGQTLTDTCRCDGKLGNVILAACKLT